MRFIFSLNRIRPRDSEKQEEQTYSSRFGFPILYSFFVFCISCFASQTASAWPDDQAIFEEPALVSLENESEKYIPDGDGDHFSIAPSEVSFSLSPLENRERLSSWLELEKNIVAQIREEGNEEIVLASARPGRKVDFSGTSDRRYPVGFQTFSWRDSSRNRTVPAKIFYPTTGGDEAFPVIVFSHGLGGSYNRCAYLGRSWAAGGFVAVLLQHPGSDENVWKGKIRIMYELKEAYKYNWSGRTRANDIRFALNCLEQMVGQGNWLGNKMDLNRIGVGGYDLGALASLLVAGQAPPDRGESLYDPRVKAVLAMSPPVNRIGKSYQETYQTIDIPTFFVTGTEDDGIVGSTKAHQRRIPFDSMQENNRYLVVLQGADHQIYGGHMLSFRARNDKPFQAAIVRSSNHFWQGHLGQQERSIEVLNGRGLNSVLGSMARVERRVYPMPDQLPEQIPLENPLELEPEKMPEIETAEEIAADERPNIKEEKTENATKTNEAIKVEATTNEASDKEASTETRPDFPLTRYYRSIVTKYDDDSTL